MNAKEEAFTKELMREVNKDRQALYDIVDLCARDNDLTVIQSIKDTALKALTPED